MVSTVLRGDDLGRSPFRYNKWPGRLVVLYLYFQNYQKSFALLFIYRLVAISYLPPSIMSTRSLSMHGNPSPEASLPGENADVAGVNDTSSRTSLDSANAPFKPGTAFMLAFGSICIITLAAALDATSLSTALPIITEKLKGTAIEAFWSGTSFLVTSAVFQPVIAGLSHVFGRKNVCPRLI